MKKKVIFLLLSGIFYLHASQNTTVGFNTIGYIADGATTDGERYYSLALDPQGRIVAVGNTETGPDGLIARYLSNGKLDTSFNSTGYINTEVGTDSWKFYNVRIDSQGRIVVVGASDVSENSGLLARFDGTGRLDTTFNGQGFIKDAAEDEADSINSYAYYDCAIDSQDRIVAVGQTDDSKGLIIYRNENGTLYTDFKATGYSSDGDSTGSEIYYGVVFDAWNELFVVGKNTSNKGMIVHYTSDWLKDGSFGRDGIVADDNAYSYNGIALQSDGKIVVFGQTGDAVDNSYGIIARYTSAGVLDTTFNSSGFVISDSTMNAGVYWMGFIDSNGKIVACGITNDQGGTEGNSGIIVRYNSDGTLDTSFNGTGYVNKEGVTNSWEYYRIVEDSQKRIIAAGWNDTVSNRALLARYLSNGVLDALSNWNFTNYRLHYLAQNLSVGLF